MIGSVLVVSSANICRAPLGAELLRVALRERGASIAVDSSGLHARDGTPADPETCLLAKRHGLLLDTHRARRLTPDAARQADLILAIDRPVQAEVREQSPELAPKLALFDQWIGAKGILDPHQRSREFHQAAYLLLRDAAHAWATRLAPTAR